MTTDLDRAHAALAAALPVLRCNLWSYLEGVLVHSDPASITPDEWDAAAPDLRAIRTVTACIGQRPDLPGVDTALLNACLAEARQ